MTSLLYWKLSHTWLVLWWRIRVFLNSPKTLFVSVKHFLYRRNFMYDATYNLAFESDENETALWTCAWFIPYTAVHINPPPTIIFQTECLSDGSGFNLKKYTVKPVKTELLRDLRFCSVWADVLFYQVYNARTLICLAIGTWLVKPGFQFMHDSAWPGFIVQVHNALNFIEGYDVRRCCKWMYLSAVVKLVTGSKQWRKNWI